MLKTHVIIETPKGDQHGQVIGQTTDEQKANDIARSRMGGSFAKTGDTYRNNQRTVDVVDKDDLRNTY